jgi:hypothetical protein
MFKINRWPDKNHRRLPRLASGRCASILLIAYLAFLSGARDVAGAEPNPASEPGEPNAAPQVDKSGFTLFHPTPPSQMRAFNSDRPDVTEGPYTVDAGHFQAEFSFVEYTHDRDHGVRTDAFSIAPATLKVGLLNNLDFEWVLNPYENIRTHSPMGSSRTAGFGETELRAKWNLWGNDGGKTAGGILPFVRLPSGTGGLGSHHVEGGVAFPLAIQELPGGFDLGTMAEFDFNRTNRNDGYGVDFIHTLTVGHDLFTEKLNVYVEYVGIAPVSTGHTYLAYFDTGVTYMLAANVQWDIGINIGLSGHATDFIVISGLSFRF